ncbi:hypothetical protein NIES932_25720 [Raphidiopsis curvata NIES-932]|jgi:hypothetical protein|nr:hypothetical protein NIES932_25720 [Raphidiopsis curvata NIES-932]
MVEGLEMWYYGTRVELFTRRMTIAMLLRHRPSFPPEAKSAVSRREER